MTNPNNPKQSSLKYGFILLLSILVASSSCRQNRSGQQSKSGKKHADINLYKGNYKLVDIHDNDSAFQVFKNQYTAQQQHVILALNRVDFNNFKQVDSLILPDSVWEDINSYTPFPTTLSALDSVDKLILFAYPIQAFAVYENGYLTRWGPTSMGSKAHPTQTGLSFANWKKEEHISTVDDEWLLRWNVNIRNEKGIGWHQYSMPGHPASHSCLRLLERDARWLYDWVDEWILDENEQLLAHGTPVIVFGTYEFDGQKPWLKLAQNPKANQITKNQLLDVIKPELKKIIEEQEKRKRIATHQS